MSAGVREWECETQHFNEKSLGTSTDVVAGCELRCCDVVGLDLTVPSRLINDAADMIAVCLYMSDV